MRWLLGALAAGILMTSFAAATSVAQPAKKDKDKEGVKTKAVDPDAIKIAGKDFDAWVKELKEAKDPSKRETAIRALVAFPPEQSIKAFGPLVAELKKHQPSTPVDLSIRCNLCIALSDLISTGQKVDPKQQQEAITWLRSFLRDSQAIMRYRAALALSAFGPEAKTAIPDILPMLKDSTTWETRQAGAAALGSLGVGDGKYGPPDEILKALYSVLGDPAYQVRMTAVQSLCNLGPNVNKEAYVAALLPVVKDREPSIEIWARIAIMGATKDFANDNMKAIMKHGDSLDPTIRAQVIQGIGAMGSSAKLGVPVLMKGLADEEISIQMSSMWALGRMETYAVSAIPELEKIIADPKSSDFQKRGAKDAIEKIKGK